MRARTVDELSNFNVMVATISRSSKVSTHQACNALQGKQLPDGDSERRA
jgi:hypothetical protein